MKCERQGFEVLDWEDGDDAAGPTWVGRRRIRQ